MTVFRYGRFSYEEGEYARRTDASPGNDLDPVVRIVEDLGTVEVPCGKVDCRANCLGSGELRTDGVQDRPARQHYLAVSFSLGNDYPSPLPGRF
jgi:hypothetical protein